LNKLRKFISLTVRDKFLFIEAFSWLLLAKLVLIILPFKRILPLLKQKESRKEGSFDVISIRDALARASTATPWLSTCLIKSMAARWMLNKRKIPSRMSIGMRKDIKGGLKMHAWISSRNIHIVNADKDYKELYFLE